MNNTRETKTSLTEKIYKDSDYNLCDIKTIVDMFLSEMYNSLLEGSSIELRGFGVFNVSVRKGNKNARNPKTGELLNLKDCCTVRFKPGKSLKEEVKKIKIKKQK